MPEPVLDFVGNPIIAGCTVCYPVRRGSSLWMTRMIVTHADAEGISGHNPTGRRTHVKNLQNVVVVNLPERKNG